MFGDSRFIQFLNLSTVEDNVIEDLNPRLGDDRSNEIFQLSSSRNSGFRGPSNCEPSSPSCTSGRSWH
jgi:hypothetical protein